MVRLVPQEQRSEWIFAQIVDLLIPRFVKQPFPPNIFVDVPVRQNLQENR